MKHAEIITRARPGSKRYRAATAGTVSGSRIAAVAGLSRYESRYAQWCRDAGYLPPVPESREMRWGTLLEPVVIAEAARRVGIKRYRAPGTYRSLTRPHATATPDAVTRDERFPIVQAKTTGYPDGWAKPCQLDEPGNALVPLDYLCQVQWEMSVYGCDRALLTVLIGGNDPRDYLIVRDDALLARLDAEARAYLESLAAGEIPDIDEHDATYQAIRDLHPDIDPHGVAVVSDELRAEVIAALRDADAADRRVTGARSRLADLMGDAKIARTQDNKTIADRRARGAGVPYVQVAKGVKDWEINT